MRKIEIIMLTKGIYVLQFCQKVKEFFRSLNKTNLCENKKFWGAVKPLLSNKVASNEKIAPVEDDKIVEENKNFASVLNKFLSNIITVLGIPQYNEAEPVSHNIGDPLMKVIMKYRFHPSLIAIKKNSQSSFSVSFSEVERDVITKEINNFKTNKATQSTDIP